LIEAAREGEGDREMSVFEWEASYVNAAGGLINVKSLDSEFNGYHIELLMT
jgi:hypothetical protein